MRRLGIGLDVTVNVQDLLKILRKNREEHVQIYTEAVSGFADHARSKVERLLSKCDGNQDVYISLKAPQNHSEAYDTVIGMLEMHQEDTITLSASEFRMLAQDKWDWMDDFLVSNQLYSATATRKLS